jgi:phosphatidylglycerol:prolipoprotein diacylglycerol transferase
MHPILFEFGPITLHSYGIMLLVAFLAVTELVRRTCQQWPSGKRPMTPQQAMDCAYITLLGGILGGRLLYILLYWSFFLASPLEMVAIWHGGLVWYGGFLGGLAAAWLYARSHKLHILKVVDLFIPFIALGHAIGRVGCLLNGCCFGRQSESWCSLQFPAIPYRVVPTQAFESLGLLALFVVLRKLQERRLDPGRLLGFYLVGYALMRFAIEFGRGDQTAFWLELTLPQYISMGLFIAGCVLAQPRRKPA